MKVFVVGIAGGVGRRVAARLVAQGVQVGGLVRRSAQVEDLAAEGIAATLGDLVTLTSEELAAFIRGYDAAVFTAGAGGEGGPEAIDQIDGAGPGKLSKAAEIAGVSRIVLVSVFPEAWRERRMDEAFEHYMVAKKQAEVELVLTDLDWVIVRPSALSNAPGTGLVDLGLAKVHEEITRDDVAETVVEVLRQPDVNRIILEVTDGATPIAAAVSTMAGAGRA
ncbi:NAD(P)H-binding protein [Roseivivax sediminis]|uniref:Nucleoside-diphosphate-sugar epimerase n=1 Tax=Roseivivax sediminis TaxID=936889 RepID=A0A1I1SYP7_9RHOB|nr:NAD(P)H-binding protein [Roseivivax sediminis]SFD51579.1 Nucleoside-diphosphate-sugar epimerase [Roseivivax sediminis]